VIITSQTSISSNNSTTVAGNIIILFLLNLVWLNATCPCKKLMKGREEEVYKVIGLIYKTLYIIYYLYYKLLFVLVRITRCTNVSFNNMHYSNNICKYMYNVYCILTLLCITRILKSTDI